MASPMVDGRVEPHRKATYTLHVSEQMRNEDREKGFSSVKYNHKPALASGTRSSTLQPSTAGTYSLSLRDTNNRGDNDMFVFNGTRTAPTKSYVLLFDPTTQKATLDRLDSTYTFNLSTHNGADVSSQHTTIYPKKPHKDSVHDKDAAEDDLFGETQERGDEGIEPEQGNPYDFRHFLHAVKSKDAGEAGYASSPDARSTPAGSTPVLPARRAVEPQAKKRKAASVFAKKPAAKGSAKSGSSSKSAGVPTVNLERRASERPASTSTPTSTATGAAKAKANSSSKPPSSGPGPSSSKIKSAEFIASSDESDVDMDTATNNANDDMDMDMDMDIDAEGDADSTFASPQPHTHPPAPSPGHRPSDSASDSDMDHDSDNQDDDDNDDGDLEIEVPDARPPTHRLNSSHLNVNARGNHRARSPSNGPISLASAANSVQNTPRVVHGDIDFDADDAGSHDRAAGTGDGGAGHTGGGGSIAKADEVDEDDPLYMEMMEGLAGGESSEESEEE
ncbi:hypothetical protein M3J07_004757 [Ascochyta lentis]